MELLTLTPMILVRLSETEWGFHQTSACTFTVTSNGTSLDVRTVPLLGTAVVSLPASPRPLPLTIRATPTTARFWPVQADFEYQGPGNLVPKLNFDFSDPMIEDTAFQPPTSIRFPLLPGNLAGGTAVSVQVFLSRVRDVTHKVLDEIQVVPAKFSAWADPNMVSRWPSQPVGNINFITERLLDDTNNLDFESDAMVIPDSSDRVFEVANVPAPQLIAMRWPDNDLPRTKTSDPTPFFVYFHPGLGQSGDYANEPYPYGWPYLFFILWRDANYVGDPLTVLPGPKGLNYQRKHSGKKVVLINPLPRLGLSPEPGVFLLAEEMEGLLRELQAFFFRRNSVYEPPGLKRVALGAFSNACGMWMLSLLANNKDHSFLRLFLKELYLFDPRMSSGALAAQANSWAEDDPTDKRIRVYLTNRDEEYGAIINDVKDFKFPPSPFVKNTANGLRTVAATRIADWVKAAKAHGASPALQQFMNAFGPVHELQPGTMANHSLKHSGFD